MPGPSLQVAEGVREVCQSMRRSCPEALPPIYTQALVVAYEAVEEAGDQDEALQVFASLAQKIAGMYAGKRLGRIPSGCPCCTGHSVPAEAATHKSAHTCPLITHVLLSREVHPLPHGHPSAIYTKPSTHPHLLPPSTHPTTSCRPPLQATTCPSRPSQTLCWSLMVSPLTQW
jgi:hypothetical protein